MIRKIHIGEDKRITLEDYELLRPWWEQRGGAAPPREILPTLGIIKETSDGTPLACGFLYLDATGSGVAWLSWMATNPEQSAQVAGRALLGALRFLEAEAKALDYWVATATLADPGFVSLMNRRGYVTGDTGLCHLFKPLHAAQPANL